MNEGFLLEGDEARLREIVANAESETDRLRAEILLAFEAGMSMRDVSEKVGIPVQRVLFWRREYLKQGLSLFDE